jgi:hypothetical protein
MLEGILKCLLGRDGGMIVISFTAFTTCTTGTTSSLFLLHTLPSLPLLKPLEQIPAPTSDGMMSLRGGQLDVFHPRLVQGVDIAAGPGIVLGARHHVEHGRPAGGPLVVLVVLLVVIFVIIAIVIVVFVRMEPPDGAALVQPVHAKPDRVGQLGTACVVSAFVGIATTAATDEGHHGIEQAAGGGGNYNVVVTAAGGAAAHGAGAHDSGALLFYSARRRRGKNRAIRSKHA